jgi:uncharacterized protein
MNNLFKLAVLSCLLGAFAFQTQSATQSAPAPRKPTFLVIYRHGPAWVDDKSPASQPMKDHGQYMLDLYKKGALKLAGPFGDGSGGAVAFEAEDENDAKAMIAADPAVKAQVFVAEFHGWKVVDWEQLIKK